jgi:hypothetical protein
LIKKNKAEIFILWFGKLPDFFPFWFKSLEINQSHFRWKLFTDQQVTSSEALQVYQLSPLQLKEEIEKFSNGKYKINIESDNFVRKCCDYRLFLPLIYGNLNSTFWGWCDIDLVFGDILSVLPNDWEDFLAFTTHPGRFAGPFSFLSPSIYGMTLMSMDKYLSSDKYNCIDESPLWFNAVKKHGKVYDNTVNLQPTRSPDALPLRKSFGVWGNGNLQVKTKKGYLDAAMMHFGKLKGHKKFIIVRSAINSNVWFCSKFGINKTSSVLSIYANRVLQLRNEF